MSSEWKSLRLGDHCTKIGSGATPRGGEEVYLQSGPYALIRSQNVYNETFRPNGLVYIDDEQAGKLANVAVEANDVLLNITGDSVARVCLAPKSVLPARVNQHVAIIRPNEEFINSRFLRYYLSSPRMQDFMLGIASAGGTRNALTKGMIEDFIIPCPSPRKQEEIAYVLESIDAKIEANLAQNQVIEQILATMYDAWFVNFLYVIDKDNLLKHGLLSHEVADLFPSELENTSEGKVPRGWERRSLSDCFDFLEGPGIRNWQYTNNESGTRFINIRCIRDGDLNLETANRVRDEEAYGKYEHFLLSDLDLVVSTSGTLGRAAIVRTPHLPLMLNTSVIRFRPIENVTTRSFLYGYIACKEFQTEIELRASGSVQKNFGPMHLKQMSVLLPPPAVLMKHEQITWPLHSKILANRLCNDYLNGVRATLLPRLISPESCPI